MSVQTNETTSSNIYGMVRLGYIAVSTK